MSIETSHIFAVQSELISGLTLVLQGIAARETTDPETKEVCDACLDHILLCFTQLGGMIEGRDQTHH